MTDKEKLRDLTAAPVDYDDNALAINNDRREQERLELDRRYCALREAVVLMMSTPLLRLRKVGEDEDSSILDSTLRDVLLTAVQFETYLRTGDIRI